ncbi:MAG TPA: SAM-dependent methyltransferase [Candidatus Hydrogenedentes bacterium]|nr:SAM-dependent methyltransferase [Candidatus Hydrogenedentota bacterium]
MTFARAHILPRSGTKRELLRKKGQFWTPDWIADVMVAYVLQGKPGRLFDPAVGQGAFFHAAKRYEQANSISLELLGYDIDKDVVNQARKSGLSDGDLRHVAIRDFVLNPPEETFPAIIANPPYIRHHRLTVEQKQNLSEFAFRATGRRIDGRAGLHVYFLIRALQSLAPEGRLAYIVSADICEGVFAHALWQWISAHYRLDGVITFSPEAAPFPDVDTNALIFFLRNMKPMTTFPWVKCLKRDAKNLISLFAGKTHNDDEGLQIFRRKLSEAIVTGLSRPPLESAHEHTLGDFATVMRGIVTGDNDFFFMTACRARELGIPNTFLTKALGRTRDVIGETFGTDDLKRLEACGRPTQLLTINGLRFDQLPTSIQTYLKEGEERGLPNKPLIRTRNPWYRMEVRKVPPIMFAYLGRRNARFIRNYAGVVPLTCLLCVYPKSDALDFVERLWKVLSHPETIANLSIVGKSYGAGAIKVEPRALERLPLPTALVQREKLDKFIHPRQDVLDFG